MKRNEFEPSMNLQNRHGNCLTKFWTEHLNCLGNAFSGRMDFSSYSYSSSYKFINNLTFSKTDSFIWNRDLFDWRKLSFGTQLPPNFPWKLSYQVLNRTSEMFGKKKRLAVGWFFPVFQRVPLRKLWTTRSFRKRIVLYENAPQKIPESNVFDNKKPPYGTKFNFHLYFAGYYAWVDLYGWFRPLEVESRFYTK